MSILTDAEWQMLENLPEEDVIALAVEMDILIPEAVDARELLDRCVLAIVERAATHGLPLSKYDAEDLHALPPAGLAAIGRLQGIKGQATVRDVLKAGKAAYKRYQRAGGGSAMALMLPLLLGAIARTADGHRVVRHS